MYIGVQSGSALAGNTIAKAGLPPGCLIVGIERAGTHILPTAGTILRAGDHVSILVPGDEAEAPLKIVHLCTGL
jgi:Trk K+ transport system NAD-binding subunit